MNATFYKINALLPNGETAHITTRDPLCWKGMIVCISLELPETKALLMCATTYTCAMVFKMSAAEARTKIQTFGIDLPTYEIIGKDAQKQTKLQRHAIRFLVRQTL